MTGWAYAATELRTVYLGVQIIADTPAECVEAAIAVLCEQHGTPWREPAGDLTWEQMAESQGLFIHAVPR